MPSPPAVVMLSANFHPYVGGAEKQALELSKALLGLGIKVRVLTRRVGGLARLDNVCGVELRRLPAWGRGLLDSIVFMVSSFLWLLRHHSEYGAVHAHLAGSPALAASLAARLLGKRAVVKLGGGRQVSEIAGSRRTAAGRMKLRALARLGPLWVAVSRDLAALLPENGIPAEAVIVPNGVDTEAYRPAGLEKGELRRRLGWPEGVVFLYAGRLSPEKRLDFFLEEFAAANGGFFVSAGAGPLEAELRTKAAELGLSGRTRFMPPAEDIAALYRAADVFVLPSLSEGLSNSLLEAMACGLGVLASRVGGTPEAVEDGESGLLFEPEDRGQLRRQLDRLLRDPELAGRLGKRAREAVLERFDMKIVAKRYKELYGL